jgi:hypothetical protein
MLSEELAMALALPVVRLRLLAPDLEEAEAAGLGMKGEASEAVCD